MGRPTSYTKKIGEEICAQLMSGKSVVSITKPKGMPSQRNLYYWLHNHEDFLQMYIHARASQQHEKFDEMMTVAYDKSIDAADKRIIVDALKFNIIKLAPRMYGDRIQQDVNLSGNVTIDNLEKGRERALKREKPED